MLSGLQSFFHEKAQLETKPDNESVLIILLPKLGAIDCNTWVLWSWLTERSGQNSAYAKDDGADKWYCGSIAKISRTAIQLTGFFLTGVGVCRSFAKICWDTTFAIILHWYSAFFDISVGLGTSVLARGAVHLCFDAFTVIPTFRAYALITL